MCHHSVGLLYKTEKLEVTPEVRSVPLGQKRRKGRPKKMPNCLIKSPVRVPVESLPPVLENVDEEHEVEEIAPTSNTACSSNTRKWKAIIDDIIEDETCAVQSPVEVLSSQILKPSYVSKPPKKRAKNTTKPVQEPETEENITKPLAVKCKKSAKACTHEVVFGEHFNKAAWKIYADCVRKKRSTIEIDPEYVPV